LTPDELATELGIEANTLRAWLRRTWPRDVPGPAWHLTAEQVAAARAHWKGEASVPASVPPYAS
jgi:hypothetical protein